MLILDVRYSDLEFEDIGRGYHKLTSDEAFIQIKYLYKTQVSTLKLKFKKGFKTDGASTPWFARFILDDWYDDMECNIPAICHDHLFIWLGDDATKTCMSFEEANLLFKALLEYYEVESDLNIQIAYKAVESFVGKKCATDTNRYDRYNMNVCDWEWK